MVAPTTPRVESFRALRAMCAVPGSRARLRRLLRDRGPAAQAHVGVARAQHDRGAASAEGGRRGARARLRALRPGTSVVISPGAALACTSMRLPAGTSSSIAPWVAETRTGAAIAPAGTRRTVARSASDLDGPAEVLEHDLVAGAAHARSLVEAARAHGAVLDRHRHRPRRCG
jgi:hypothetical protein